MQHTAVSHFLRNTLTLVGVVFVLVIVPLTTGVIGSQATGQTTGDRAASFGHAVTAAFPTAEAGFVATDARDRS